MQLAKTLTSQSDSFGVASVASILHAMKKKNGPLLRRSEVFCESLLLQVHPRRRNKDQPVLRAISREADLAR